VAARTNEAHEVRLQNRALYEENARLNDLARMLLGSPHFSNFLNDMGDTMPAQPQQQVQQQPQQQPQTQQAPQPNMQAIPKDTNTNHGQEFQMQQNPQPNMVMVPNQGMDPSSMGMNNAGWNSGIDMNYNNTPVFAVTEVPEGPALDAELLSGKSSSFGIPEGIKNEAPVVDSPTFDSSSSDIGVANPDVEIDESDPAFALFIDTPPIAADTAFEGVSSEKTTQFELVVDNSEVSISAKKTFIALCNSIDAAFERVSVATSHLQ
jgi:uncharacterized short protein YbdD (DUF466 family)